MAVKSAYREKNVNKSPQVVEEAAREPETAQSDIPQTTVNVEETKPNTDKAADAEDSLLQQMQELRRANEFQFQQAQKFQAVQGLQQPTTTREQKLAYWKTLGISEKEEQFLKDNPEMIDLSPLANIAANQAMAAGHQRDTDDYFQATKEIFARLIEQQQQQAAPQAATETPAFFTPRPSKPAPSPGPLVSAPVSREVPTSDRAPRLETDPRRVTLSPEEMEIARNSGITAAEYARQKVRLAQEKASGRY